MESRLIRFLLPVLLVLPIKGTDLSFNGTFSLQDDARVPRANRRVVRLYSGVRPKPIVCAGEGFQPDPDDCSIFHRCMKGGNGKYLSFRFQCGPGTIYDPETEICNHPQRTRRTECGGNGPVHVPNIEFTLENDISREIPSPMSTRRPLSTQTSSETKVHTAKYPWKSTSHYYSQSTQSVYNPFLTIVKQKDAETNKIPTKRQVTESSTNSIAHLWMSSQKSSPVTQRTTSQPGDICASEGFVGDSEDCRKFYRCINNQRGGFIRYEFLCNEPTIWDDEKQACNHAWAVKRRRCGRVSSLDKVDALSKKDQVELFTSKNTAPDSSQSQSQISYGSKVTQIQTQISNGSVIQNQTQINYGNDSSNVNSHNVQNQTQISHGNAVSQAQTQIDYGDKAVQTQLQIDHSKEASQTQTQISQSSTTTKTTQYHETQATSSSSSNNKCTESGFRGDSEDCKKFYRCVDNGRGGFTRYEFSCGEGTVWDPKLDACNHAWAVKECGGKAPSDSTTQSHTSTTQLTTKPITSSSTFSTTTTTTHSYSSSTETIEEDNDIPYGNQPASSSKPSEQETTVTQSPQNSNDNKCSSSGFIGDRTDCKKFYRCVDNGNGGYTRYEFSCGEGTVWDQKIEACNHVWAVPNCGVNPTTTSTAASTIQNTNTQTSSQRPPVIDDDYDTGYGLQNNEPQSPSTTVATSTVKSSSTTTHHLSGSNNACTSSGFMGDNNDCKKFYRCVDNGNGAYTRYEFSCGEGTVWDSKIQACNHARDVEHCGGNSVEDINKVETTTRKESESTMKSTTHISQPDEDNDVGYGQQSNGPQSIATTSSPGDHVTGKNECTYSGFMGDSSDCKKFYRCVDNGDGTFTRYEFSCGEGTVWDSKIEACNHAWAVEKCGGTSTSQATSPKPAQTTHAIENTGGSTAQSDEYSTQSTTTTSSSISSSTTVFSSDDLCKSSGFMGDSKDCKRFYRCVEDGRGGFARYEFACGEGTVWDQSIDACNHAWAVKGKCSQSVSDSSSNNVQPTAQTPSMGNESESENQGQSTTQKTSTSTNTVSNSGNQCSQEGFYGDESNCKNFYRCVNNGQGDFIKYEFTCGEGTVWDQDIQACDHESPGKQCNIQSSGSTTKTPNHENDEIMTDSTTKRPESSTENNDDNNYTQENIEIPDDTCKSDGFYGDSKDCQKFYRCVDNGKGGYTKYEFTCGDGTYWDQEILACDHASNSKKCTTSPTSPTTVATTSTSETSMTGNSTNTLEPQKPQPTEAPNSGNDQCTMEGFYANSKDCKKFYRCVSNGKGGFTKYDFSCGEGTVWVQEIQACDYDNDISSCSNKNNSSKPDTNEEHESSTSGSLSTNEYTTQHHIPDKENDEYPASDSSKPQTGSEPCTSEGFFANKNDCTKFYRCVDNGKGGFTKYDFTCGEGTAWDSNIQTCNHISEVESCKSTNEQTNSSSNDESSQSTQSTSTTKDSSSTESSRPDKCDQEGYFGNSQDCTKFYRCVDNGKGGLTKYDFTCGEGTIWDQDLTTCNHPQDVTNPSCEKNEGGDSSSSSSSSTESSGTNSASSTNPQGSQGTTEGNTEGSSNCSQESSSEKPTNQKVKCEKAGFYPNPDDCKKFYRCVDWDGNGDKFSVYHFDCGEGTIWDPQLETCNHEDSVFPPRNCSGTQTQNQNASQETTTTEKSTTSQDNSSTESSTTTQSSTEESTSPQQSTSSEQTTQQSSTTDNNTTQQPTTSEQTTQETNTDKTTTQQTTTDKTTTQQTSSENTSTQQTSTEKTTTQQTTSSEQTTTPSEQTTTEQPTTSQELTTQETATSQQSTTSEQTTTEHVTTTEQTTTQLSTTSQQSTTNEQTTQESSSSEEQTTTQQSTTSEQTTQQSSNTDATTTESGHTEQQSTTTSDQTTTTTEQTDQQSTTEQSTTENTTEQGTATTESSTTTTTTTESTENTTTESENGTSSEKECPETEDDQYMYVCPTSFRRHPKYCNMFYQCTEDNDSHDVKVANFKCPNNTIYDESKTQCVEEDKADKKCNGQIARKLRFKRRNADYKEPIEVSRSVLNCPAVGYYPFEKENECSGAFFKCQMTKSGKLRGQVHRCPEGYTYWSISKRCEKNHYMKDCKQSANIWSNRYEIPVEKKNIAK